MPQVESPHHSYVKLNLRRESDEGEQVHWRRNLPKNFKGIKAKTQRSSLEQLSIEQIIKNPKSPLVGAVIDSLLFRQTICPYISSCAILPCNCCNPDEELAFCFLHEKMITTVELETCCVRPIPKEIQDFTPNEDGEILIWTKDVKRSLVACGSGGPTSAKSNASERQCDFMVVTKTGFYSNPFSIEWKDHVSDENHFLGYVYDATNPKEIVRSVKRFDGTLQFASKTRDAKRLNWKNAGYVFSTGDPDLDVLFHKVIQSQLRIFRETGLAGSKD